MDATGRHSTRSQISVNLGVLGLFIGRGLLANW